MAGTDREKADRLKDLMRAWRARRSAAAESEQRPHAAVGRGQWRDMRRRLLDPALPDVALTALLETLARPGPDSAPATPWPLGRAVAQLQALGGDAQWFAAMRLLHAASAGAVPLGHSTSPRQEAVRIDQGLALGFVGRELRSIKQPAATAPMSRVRVVQDAVGLLGPNGPMPLAWTQHADELARVTSATGANEGASFLAFINVLQRRQLGFLYRAWSDTEVVTAFDAMPADGTPAHGIAHPLTDRLRALAGFAHADLNGRDSLDDGYRLAHAASLSRRVRNPATMVRWLEQYLTVPVRVHEYVPRWTVLSEDQQSRLGLQHSQLGRGVAIGAYAWEPASKFRVVLGPMKLPQYQRFLPRCSGFTEVRDLVAMYVGPEWHWELKLELFPDEVPPLRLGAPGCELGWSSWLDGRDSKAAAGDLRIEMEAPLSTPSEPSDTQEVEMPLPPLESDAPEPAPSVTE